MAQTKSELPDNIKPKTFVSSWDEHVLSWTNNSLDVPKPILKYEDLVYNKEQALHVIISFFEKNFNIKFDLIKEKITNIIETTDFDGLKSYEERYGFEEAVSGSFFRKGIKNQWKDELNIKQIKKIENKFRDFMNKFGYY